MQGMACAERPTTRSSIMNFRSAPSSWWQEMWKGCSAAPQWTRARGAEGDEQMVVDSVQISRHSFSWHRRCARPAELIHVMYRYLHDSVFIPCMSMGSWYVLGIAARDVFDAPSSGPY